MVSICQFVRISSGFRRPLQLYTKADTSGNTPYTDIDENSQSSRSHVLAPTLQSVASPQPADSQDTASEKGKTAGPVQQGPGQSAGQSDASSGQQMKGPGLPTPPCGEQMDVAICEDSTQEDTAS